MTMFGAVIEDLGEEDRRGRRSFATQLVDIVREHASELCHDGDGECYIRFIVDGHIETWPLDSRGTREWMCRLYYTKHGSVPRAQSISDAISALSGIAKYDGPARDVYLRTAAVNGAVIHDLCDPAWRAVTINSSGWSVGPAPVIFRRGGPMRAVIEPVTGGSINDVIDLLGVPQSEARHVVVWVVASIIGSGPVPVLEFVGAAGSGKTTLVRRVRSMVDPTDADARSAPRSVDDLYVAAHHSHVLALDNLSHISPEMSDALCVICTGVGYARRTLFTTSEETVLRVRRPIMLTAVSPVITASDLLDRVVCITLPMRDDAERLADGDLDGKWAASLPRTMGAIYDLAAAVLRVRPSVRLASLPRMSEYCVIGEAVSQVCGWLSYADQYRAHRIELAARGVESSPVAVALLALMRAQVSYTGTVGNLAKVLERYRADGEAWPRSVRGVSDALKRAMPGFVSAGLRLEWDPVRRTDGYHLTVRRGPEWVG